MPPKTDSIETLTAYAAKRTQALIRDAERRFGATMPLPEIRFDLRGKTAGQLRIHSNGFLRIRYNPTILTRHPKGFLAQTVPHETAHLVAYQLYGNGIRPHGIEWQRIMLTFGARPERCHSYDVEDLGTRRITRFDYHCHCNTHRLTSIRHRRILAGQVYRCRQCGGNLSYGAHPGSPAE